MDLVSRLKIFMNHIGISSSQFADTSGIPRPTLSQLLTGRNKKVSDELITKIHDAFPSLSIPWLMFGEGEMVSNTNTQFSEPQNSDFSAIIPGFNFNNQEFTPQENPFQNVSTFSSENFTSQERQKSSDFTSDSAKPPSKSTPLSVNVPPRQGKRITNIVVFYDDSSFESFSPA